MPVTTALPRGARLASPGDSPPEPFSSPPSLLCVFTESLKLSSRGGARGELGALGLGANPTPEMCG